MAYETLAIMGLVIFFLELSISIVILFPLWRRWRETRLPIIAILTGLFFVFISFVGIEFLSFLNNFENPVQFYLNEQNLIAALFPFYGGISAGIFLLFIDFFRKDRVSSTHTLLYGAFLGTFLFNMIYKVIFPDFTVSLALSSTGNTLNSNTIILFLLNILFTTNFPAAYFIGYVIIDTLISLQKIKGQVTEIKQKTQVLLLQLTIFFFYAIPIIFVVIARFISDSIDPQFLIFLRHLAPHISVIIGFFFLYVAYVRAPLGLLQFHRLEKLMVINKSGLLLYSYDFVTTADSDDSRRSRDVLYSGGVLAVINLFTEMIETTEVEMIQFQEQIIMLSNNDNFITFLITDHTSRFLWTALASFSQMFYLKYGSDAKEMTVVPKHVFEDTLDIIKIAFGR